MEENCQAAMEGSEEVPHVPVKQLPPVRGKNDAEKVPQVREKAGKKVVPVKQLPPVRGKSDAEEVPKVREKAGKKVVPQAHKQAAGEVLQHHGQCGKKVEDGTVVPQAHMQVVVPGKKVAREALQHPTLIGKMVGVGAVGGVVPQANRQDVVPGKRVVAEEVKDGEEGAVEQGAAYREEQGTQNKSCQVKTLNLIYSEEDEELDEPVHLFRHQPLASAQGESPGCSNFPPKPEKSPEILGGGVQGGGKADHETVTGSNAVHKAGPLGGPGVVVERLDGLVRGKIDKGEPHSSCKPTGTVAGLEHQVRKVNILEKLMTGTVRKQSPVSKKAGKKTSGRNSRKKEEKVEDVSGMAEMRNMMRIWTSKKRNRDELGEGDGHDHVEPLPGPGDDQVRVVVDDVVDVEQHDQGTVDRLVVDVDLVKNETLVEKARKKFDSKLPSANSYPDQDYDSWKLRREERKRRLREQAGHVLLEGGVQGSGGVDKDPKRLKLDSVSETGKNLKRKCITNQQCYSLLGGNEAGVQRGEGGQEGDGDRVQPVQLESDRQCATRMVGKISWV